MEYVDQSYFNENSTVSFRESDFKIAFTVLDYKTGEMLMDESHVEWQVFMEDRNSLITLNS